MLGTSIIHLWDHIDPASARSVTLNESVTAGSGQLQISLEVRSLLLVSFTRILIVLDSGLLLWTTIDNL